MKNISFIIISLLFINETLGQVNFRTADSRNGIIGRKFSGFDIGYSFSSSSANFSFRKTKTKGYYYYLENGKQIRVRAKDTASYLSQGTKPPLEVGNYFIGNNIRITVPISDNSRQLFGSGNFNPGVDVSFDHSWNKDELQPKTTYYFLRAGYEIAENRFGSIDVNDTIRINEKLTHKFGLSFGANLISTYVKGLKIKEISKDSLEKTLKDNIIIAGFISLDYNINPITGLRNREFTIEEGNGVNGSIQRTINAFTSEQKDFFSITPKIDFVWTPISLEKIKEKEEFPRIGILSSISTRYNTQINRFAWNFSIGPSLHPKDDSSRIIAAILGEFRDFSNTRNDRNFDDIFSINLYIGIPLALM